MSKSRWTFFTNHSHVLFHINTYPELPMREIALKVGITERAVQNIVSDLIQAGALSIEKIGRNNKYMVNGDIPLRHPIESHRTISDLLIFISNGGVNGSSE